MSSARPGIIACSILVGIGVLILSLVSADPYAFVLIVAGLLSGARGRQILGFLERLSSPSDKSMHL